MVASNLLTLLSLCAAVMAVTYDSTTTVTTTPYTTITTTVGLIEEIYETAYIYTNSDSKLTTDYVTGLTVFRVATGTPTSVGQATSVTSPIVASSPV